MPLGLAQPQLQAIADSGPPVEIPTAQRSHVKLFIALVFVASIPLGLGWACGRIFAARALFNKTIEDARTIRAEVIAMARVNKQVAVTLARARARARGRLVYDKALLEELKTILRRSPDANPEQARKRQERLFQTNYAMMEGIVIERLFKYYNNTLRLTGALQDFVQQAEGSRELIESYGSSAARQRKHGIVVVEDAGTHYRGRLVEVGNIVCSDERAGNRCRRSAIRGFFVRFGDSSAWSPRSGRPGPNGKIARVVIPIIPDESWRQIATAKRGHVAYRDYVRGFSRVAAIAALLSKEEKSLKQDLSKAAGRAQLYTPF